nr:DDE-type integrase/transposase/recombinase [Aquamicrobium sp. NLF2-7]
MPDEKKASATGFLERALGLFEADGITIERVMTDNGGACKSHLFRKALADHGIRHKRTTPYTPRTKGNAGRFIQTSLREWLCAKTILQLQTTNRSNARLGVRLRQPETSFRSRRKPPVNTQSAHGRGLPDCPGGATANRLSGRRFGSVPWLDR